MLMAPNHAGTFVAIERRLRGEIMTLHRSEDRVSVSMDEFALEAHHEEMNVPLVGFVTAAVISIGMWSLIVLTLWNLVP
jgi:hypothetical protein